MVLRPDSIADELPLPEDLPSFGDILRKYPNGEDVIAIMETHPKEQFDFDTVEPVFLASKQRILAGENRIEAQAQDYSLTIQVTDAAIQLYCNHPSYPEGVCCLDFQCSDAGAFIFDRYVHPSFRNQGVGSLFLKHMEDIIVQHGITSVTCNSFQIDVLYWLYKSGYVPVNQKDHIALQRAFSPHASDDITFMSDSFGLYFGLDGELRELCLQKKLDPTTVVQDSDVRLGLDGLFKRT